MSSRPVCPQSCLIAIAEGVTSTFELESYRRERLAFVGDALGRKGLLHRTWRCERLPQEHGRVCDQRLDGIDERGTVRAVRVKALKDRLSFAPRLEQLFRRGHRLTVRLSRGYGRVRSYASDGPRAFVRTVGRSGTKIRPGRPGTLAYLSERHACDFVGGLVQRCAFSGLSSWP